MNSIVWFFFLPIKERWIRLYVHHLVYKDVHRQVLLIKLSFASITSFKYLIADPYSNASEVYLPALDDEDRFHFGCQGFLYTITIGRIE